MPRFVCGERGWPCSNQALSCCISSCTSKAGNKLWSLSPLSGWVPRAFKHITVFIPRRSRPSQKSACHVFSAVSRRGLSCQVGRNNGSVSPEPCISRLTWSFWWVCTPTHTHPHPHNHAHTHLHSNHCVYFQLTELLISLIFSIHSGTVFLFLMLS